MKAAYLDQASTSHPKPPELLEGISHYLSTIGASPGRGGYALTEAAEQLVNRTRYTLAELLNAPFHNNLAFTSNATQALNIVIKGYIKPGDHVLISNFEHNAVLRPLHKMSQDNEVSYSIFSSDDEGNFNLDSLASKIRPNTKLIIINHASNVLGVISPLRQICEIAHKNGIPILADLSQSAGILPLDIAGMDLDFAAGTGHKGLLGPSGTGFLYVKNPDLVDTLFEGGSGPNSLSRLHPGTSPMKFEAGTLNYLGISGLLSTLGYIKRVGMERIYKRSMQLIQQAMFELEQIPGVTIYGTRDMRNKVPILSCNIAGYTPSEVAYFLDQRGICVRAGLQCAPLIHQTLETAPEGTVRISAGHLNTEEEIQRLVNGFAELAETSSAQTFRYG